MAKKTIIYWRDIPSQVVVQKGRTRQKALLCARFQEAIDRAAMRAGKGSSEAYLAEWRRVAETCDSPEDLVGFIAEEVSRLESEYSDERLLELVRKQGSEQ